MTIPNESRALTYIQTKGWDFQVVGDQAKVALCPLCSNPNGKFYINVSGDNRDGLWDCKTCAEAGNLGKLMSLLGDTGSAYATGQSVLSTSVPGLVSMRGVVAQEPLPDVSAAHRRLMDDEEALDYLIGTRGFSLEIIEKFELGVDTRADGKWLLIPYRVKGNLVFAKWRSLPPLEKAFRGTTGRAAPLFNEDVVQPGMEELLFVEGEADALSCLSNGISYVVGIPGAALKKVNWIEKVDNCAPKKVYLCYDSDKVGQKGALEMAQRLGIEKCLNIVLPEFTTVDGKPGKDINEWFRAGHTLEEFEELKKTAHPFDVEGVSSVEDALTELEEELIGRGSAEPTYKTPWPSLNNKLGGAEPGDVVGLIAEGKIGKTTMALNWLDYYVANGVSCLMYCLEMPPKRLVRKWACFITETDDSPGHSQFCLATLKKARTTATEREADLLFAYSKRGNRHEVFDKIRQVVRRYGVKVVCFDYLQQLCRSIEHSAQETAVISREFKQLAMELGILVLLIVQPNRVRDGEVVSAKNALGSSSIEKDVDSMIGLHRKRIASKKEDDLITCMDTEATFEPQMHVMVDLNRYGPGGNTVLWLEGGISKVREFNPEELSALPKPVMGAEIPTERVAV